MHQGSCLCGTVQYEIRGNFGAAYFCHCRRCRKAGGSSFAANVIVQSADFAITAGETSLKCFDGGQGVKRYFCVACGSPILSRRPTQADIVRVRMGTLDTAVAAPPQAHQFVDSKAEWVEIRDALPQHAERPPV